MVSTSAIGWIQLSAISVKYLNGEHTLTPFVLLSEREEKENETVKVDQYAVSVRPVWQRAAVSPRRPPVCASKTLADRVDGSDLPLWQSCDRRFRLRVPRAWQGCAGPLSNRQYSIKGVRFGTRDVSSWRHEIWFLETI